MDLSEILDDRIICVNMSAQNKEEAITFLSNKLKDSNYIDDVESFKKDIYYRESLGITGIGNYIAIPHGKSDSVKKIGIAIGKLKDEIKWETLDNKGVKVIFLFAVCNNNDYAKKHLMLLSELASKLGDDERVSKVLKANSIDDIKKAFF
ncbi:MAG: fructose PTS transporter subunit IIA [Clostridium sp.]|jgi:PTS system fructose-specific IIA component|uniref:PTS sugar transporter subunit IIA n=1 Tax=Clostridium sp. TaxID=1506 RepID=UPI0025BA597F|nr:fructose PTS transporter subunit IIA [Clostridium sp.]MCH3964847.1 fructose PTS transporter subunit IIA [Clostridium sp.]MCI1716658.1 fructose PTS transporter subunit IIA [Clostridium sp.]MCI1800860.1 fructose PTS transporter subunit IIA [Clostridium sp.]MCI1814835.1 fructose PTS transporter subunit IIA [Clostridium sp.]MCI1871607.1 fructose PTS transporter subunit IIA [Clostridium sp.]